MNPESSPVPGTGDADGPAMNRKALFSILFGVAGFAILFAFPYGGFVLGLPAITTGIHARREIVEAQGRETGDGLAVCGLIIGGAAIVVAVITFGMDAFLGG